MKNLQKHLMTVTSKRCARPILNGVNFCSQSKRMIATDAHRLLSYEYDGDFIVDKTVNLDTMEVIDGEYPGTSGLIPKNGIRIMLNVNEIKKEMTSQLTKNKKEFIRIKFIDEAMVFQLEKIDEETFENTYIDMFTLLVECEESLNNLDDIYFNAEYMRDLFRFVNDYSSTHKDDVVEILYIGRVRPMLFSTKKFDYLITPIRK